MNDPIVSTASTHFVLTPRLFVGGMVLCAVLSIAGGALFGRAGSSVQEGAVSYEEYDCNTLGINLHGEITTYISPEDRSQDTEGEVLSDMVASEDIVAAIEGAVEDDRIKAILLDIDSPGGLPVAAEEIATALKNVKKPTASVIRQSGLSAAYWVASATDRIFASRNSDVGSIGVTMSYLRNMNEPGQYVELASGKFKDTGDPDKVLSQEERALLLRDVVRIHKNFIEDVATNRFLSIEKVEAIADGSSVLGTEAKALGLIDEIGSWNEAKMYLKGRIGEPVSVCWR